MGDRHLMHLSVTLGGIHSRGGTLLVGSTSRHTVNGLTLAFDMLVDGFVEYRLPYRVVDLSNAGRAKCAGSFEPKRALATARLIAIFLRHLPWARRVYITIASSRLGFLRDAMMILTAKALGRRVVLHLHGGGYETFYPSQPDWLKKVIAATLSQADTIIVLGERLRSQFSFVKRAEEKLVVVRNGLPLQLDPGDVVEKTYSGDQPFHLLFLSNLMKSKGYLDVLAACRILCQRQRDVVCDFAGEFSQTAADASSSNASCDANEFFELIRDWGLANVIRYHGVARGKQKQELLQRAHALVLPTTYRWEGQPISIIEALAFGLPVIATPHRGIPEQVIDGYNGVIVKPNSPSEIADAVERLMSDSITYTAMSRAALRHFNQYFTREAHLSRLITVIMGNPPNL